MIFRRWSALGVLAVTVIGLGGCLPNRTVWLPDSSGFLFSTDGPWNSDHGQTASLIHYDLNRKAARSFKDLPTLSTMMAGVSPDGKQVAFVRALLSGEQPVAAEVSLVDLKTGLVHKSKPFPFKAREKSIPCAVAEWAPKGDRLLIAPCSEDAPSIRDTAPDLPLPTLGSYVVKGESGPVYSDFAMTFLDRPLNGSIAGDGSGFLAFSRKKLEDFRKGRLRATFDGAWSNPFEALVFVD